jgi:hypothetical protein
MFRLYTPFVARFCEDGDLLSQWRGYGNDGEGFPLGLSVPWLLGLENDGFRLQRVIYDRRRAHQTELVLMFLDKARPPSRKVFIERGADKVLEGSCGIFGSLGRYVQRPRF